MGGGAEGVSSYKRVMRANGAAAAGSLIESSGPPGAFHGGGGGRADEAAGTLAAQRCGPFPFNVQ
ncbi:hypothetical protein EYF80_041227 [Liparis tanakae]|uniref:Uncharacterized protein n=1 Tax=Liparis tanakae TaxID=230148 RepID=A0A4Z2G668_9TELE|nr:hypothetical protein EYF80_041227 [Liparis tanakae]